MILCFAALGLGVVCGSTKISAQSQPTEPVILGGVEWTNDLERARAVAVETGKPILWFDMIGRLDETWC